jgi:phospholipid/cholesterol/gamma-HCH transport system substrate-binding protein
MKSFRERNTAALGGAALVVVALVVLFVLNINTVIALFGRHYSAMFSEAGGIKSGDPVEVSGMQVGRVTDVKLSGPGVLVSFSVTNDQIHLGSQTTAAINVATVLGDKALVLTSAGPGSLSQDGQIPLARTASPYDVTQALSHLTTDVGQIDVTQVSAAFDQISKTLNGSAPQIQAAISGVGRLAKTIGGRDQVLESLLGHANTFASVLAGRATDMQTLVKDGNTLFGDLLERRAQISSLLSNVSSMSAQLSALVDQNQHVVGPALKQLDGVTTLLRKNEANIDKSLRGLAVYATGLGEVVAGGPFFTAYLQNLIPGNFFPPSITIPGLTGVK